MIKKFSTLFLATTIALSMFSVASASPQTTAVNTEAKYNSQLIDIQSSNVKEDIEYLFGRGIVKGYENGEFRPDSTLNYAEAIQLITKAFYLNTTVTNELEIEQKLVEKKWYNDAFNIAEKHSIQLDETINISDNVTREQFASWIVDQLDAIGPYPVPRMYIHIADGEQITSDIYGKIQNLLLTNIAQIDETQLFRPQDSISRAEAADWLADAVKFADQLKEKQQINKLLDLPFDFKEDMHLTEKQAKLMVANAFDIQVDENTSEDDYVTREQLATWIVDELNKKGSYPVKMMFIHIADEQDITVEMSNMVHTLLLIDVAELDEHGKFYPQSKVTGSEALNWLNKTMNFAALFNL